MTAKQFLDGIRNMRMAIDSKKAKIAVLREIATNTSAHLTGMPHNPSSEKSPMANAVCKIVDLESDIAELEQKRQMAIDTLCEMENSDFCAILVKRYVQEKPWEDISAEMYCCRAQAFKLHKAAIASLEILLLKVDANRLS
jgi:hypothetical protein